MKNNTKQKTNHVKRRGSATKRKSPTYKLVRQVLVRRWLIMAVIRIVSWLITRWSDKDHPGLSP